MRNIGWLCTCVLVLAAYALAAPRQHVVAFGKWTTVKLLTGDDESKPVDMKVRPLSVDGRTKEFTTGPAHEVTERLFVVQRAYRLNDLLPQEGGAARWRWERGAWLLVDRVSGNSRAIPLPDFDAYSSEVSWFRDYAAYCGVSEDGEKAFTVVAQLGKRKPLLKKVEKVEKANSEGTSQNCPAPLWSRAPARVTFAPSGEPKFTFTMKSQAVDVAIGQIDEGEN